MGGLELAAFAFATGSVVAGMSVTVMELMTGRVAHFGPPFAEPDRILRSLGAVFIGGPIMLLAQALGTTRPGVIGHVACAALALVAAVWAAALGVVTLELATLVSRAIAD